MRQSYCLAASTGLALALAACGGPSSDGDAGQDSSAATGAQSASPTGEVGAAGEPGEGQAGAQGDAGDGAGSAGATPAASGAATAAQVSQPPAFAQCKVCHSIEPGQNNIGPSLAGIFGRKAGTVAGYSYTPGMDDMGISWNEANLDKYLTDPQAMVSDTTMALIPLTPADRAAIIAYLKTL